MAFTIIGKKYFYKIITKETVHKFIKVYGGTSQLAFIISVKKDFFKIITVETEYKFIKVQEKRS